MKNITIGTVLKFLCKLFGVFLLGALKVANVILTEVIKLLEKALN